MTTVEELVRITAQHNELMKRVANGSLDPGLVRKALQRIIEGSFLDTNVAPSARSLPSWYVDPETQLDVARLANEQRNWGFRYEEFPYIPEDTTKLWLLTVQLPAGLYQEGLSLTMDELWDLIEPRNGFGKYIDGSLGLKSGGLRVAPGYEHTPGIRWVEFDPQYANRMSPREALEQASRDNLGLAGSELLSAVWQFPEWALTWDTAESPRPYMAGLQCSSYSQRHRPLWIGVPFLYLDRLTSSLAMSVDYVDKAHRGFSSPSIKELVEPVASNA